MVSLAKGWRSASSGGQVPQLQVYSGAGVSVSQDFLCSTFQGPHLNAGNTFNWPFTATVGKTGHKLTNAYSHAAMERVETVVFSSTGTLPAPLQAGVTYYVIDGNGVDFRVSSSAGGASIEFVSVGSGTHTANHYLTDLGMPPMIGRSLDAAPTWAQINTANGTYDWTAMDEYMTYHYKDRGRKIIYCIAQTPGWAARDQTVDVYGFAGGGQVPTSLATGATFITALITRYNTTTAFNPTGAKMIFAVEVANEPTFLPTGSNGTWCGTTAELAQFTRLVKVAGKAVDASLLILSPGFTHGVARIPPSLTDNSMYNYLLASDGIGGVGKDHVDGVCYHGYDTSDSILTGQVGKIATYRAIMQSAGLSGSFPLYQTERGVDLGNHPNHVLRCAAIDAALGIKMSVMYTNDSYGIHPRNNPTLRAAISSFYNLVCGKTMTYCAIEQDGSVTVVCNGVTTKF